MAQKYGDWHCGIEDFAVLALDIDSQCRSEKRGLRAPSLQVAGLTHYLGLPPYDPGPEIGLVETSCTAEVLSILKTAKMSTSLGCAVYKWTREEATRDLRVPAILQMGVCSAPFALARHQKRPDDNKDVCPFVAAFRKLATDLGADPDLEPRQKVDNPEHEDSSVDVDRARDGQLVSTYGAVRISGSLTERALTSSGTPPDLGLENALLIVARIGLRSPAGVEERSIPEILSMVLSNGFARILEIYDNEAVPDGRRRPAGTLLSACAKRIRRTCGARSSGTSAPKTSS